VWKPEKPGIRPNENPKNTDKKIKTGETLPRNTAKSFLINLGRSILIPPVLLRMY
jgi:hypothetical protein